MPLHHQTGTCGGKFATVATSFCACRVLRCRRWALRILCLFLASLTARLPWWRSMWRLPPPSTSSEHGTLERSSSPWHTYAFHSATLGVHAGSGAKVPPGRERDDGQRSTGLGGDGAIRPPRVLPHPCGRLCRSPRRRWRRRRRRRRWQRRHRRRRGRCGRWSTSSVWARGSRRSGWGKGTGRGGEAAAA